MKNKIAFTSLGCPKNLVDSEKIITALKIAGYEFVTDYKIADLEIINTCGFINEAIEESLGAIKAAISQNGKVIVTGCLGTKKELILKKFPQVLSVTGPNNLEEIVKAVKQHLPISKHQCNELPAIGIKLTPPHYAYVKIAEGCNQRCSYCIIPQLRGPLVSCQPVAIQTEIQNLIDNNVKEILIIAQDTGAYGQDLNEPINIIDLVRAIPCGRPKKGRHGGLPLRNRIWIRLHYVYPYPFVDKLVELMAAGKILPYLDVPLQHASQRILKLMQRPGDYDNILERIAKWRKICPEITIRSTFIVGFPGETEAEFNELLAFLTAAQLDRVGCFKYSPVEGAKANELPNQISAEIKEQRFHQLMTLQQQISKQRLAAKIGKILPVIVDHVETPNLGVSSDSSGVSSKIIGRTKGDAPDIDGQVIVTGGKAKPGDFIEVKITDADEYDLFGIAS